MNRSPVFSRRMNYRARLIISLAAAGFGLLPSSDALGVNTTFTNANNNLLWADPGNWSTGVPTSADTAIFATAPGGAVDLGDAVRPVAFLRLNGNGHVLGNGTLVVGGSFLSVVADGSALINANLTNPSGGLLSLSGAGLDVAGTIFGNLRLNGTGQLSGTNTYTGVTSVQSFVLPNAGSAAASSRWDVAGTLRLEYGPAGSVDKIGDAAPINMWTSTLQFHNASGVPVNESVGTITLEHSANTIQVSTTNSAAGPISVNLPTIVRENYASALLDVNPAQGTRLVATGARSTPDPEAGVQNVIYGWLMGMVKPTPDAVEGPLSFITVTDSNGLRPLNLATEYNSSIDGSITDVRLTAPQTINSSTAAHSLVLHGAGVQLNNAQLNLSTGALALSADASAAAEITAFSGTGTLVTSASEMHVWTDAVLGNRHQYRIDVPVSAPILTKSGPGGLVLSKRNSIGSLVNLNQGTLLAAADGALGDANTTLSLRFGANAHFRSASQHYGTLSMATFRATETGLSTVNGIVTVDSGIVATFDHFAGTGSISKFGNGRLRFAGDSVTVGAGGINLVGGSVQIDGVYQTIPYQLSGGGNSLSTPIIQGFGTLTVLGTGTILAGVNVSIAPGVDAPGRLSIGSITTSSSPGATLFAELAGHSAGVNYDQLVLLNSATLTGRTLSVDLLSGFDPALGSQFLIVDDRFAGAVTGTFSGLPQGSVFFADGRAFQIDYLGGDGNDVVLTAVVPEPANVVFVVAGGALLHRRRGFSCSKKRSS